MTTTPDLCVLIPAWKDQQGLLSTLEVLAAEELPFDVVVIDDGSPTPLTCPERCGSHEIIFHRLPRNKGIEHALNAGLEIIFARGYRHISRLDCGDLPMPGRLARQVEFLDAHPEVGIVGTWARCLDDDGKYLFTLRFPTEHKAMLRKQRYVPAMLHPTVMIRAEALRKVGTYSDRYKTAEDYDLFVRMGKEYQLANIPEVLTEYVLSQGGTTTSRRRINLVSRLRVQLDNFGWLDPHAYLGVGRTVAFTVIPFSWLNAAKQVVWR